MEPTMWLVAAVFVTSSISGIFGMGGGMILMGLYAWLMPVASAMVLHGATQLAANGFRALLLLGKVRWSVVRPYVLGTLAAVMLLAPLGLVVPRGVLYLLLGLLPFLGLAGNGLRRFDVTRSRAAGLCGALVTACHLTAGVAGPLLDVFFLQAPLAPEGIIATKAATQVLGHLVKIVYFGELVGAGASLPPLRLLAPVVAAAFVGTLVGKRFLVGMDEKRFRRLSRAILLVMGVAYLAKAGLELG